MIEIRGLNVYRGSQHILHDIDLNILPSHFTALIGPNGSGKSTLLGSMATTVAIQSGHMKLGSKQLSSYSRRELAQQMAFLPQHVHTPAGMNVRELLAQGRFPWRSWLGGWSRRDEDAVTRAVELCGIEQLLDRPLQNLSGGQLQRAWIAMTLVQDTPIILLDEPTTFLDVANQLSLLDLLSVLRDAGRTVVAILHDLNQAARYADQLVMLKDGRVVAEGNTQQVFTATNIDSVFSVRSRMVDDPETGIAMCIASSSA
ncbi:MULTISPECIES: ABC transporter ATP-binding protein [unclassified Ochrobactrum]|uniref:ABC transporter ATP-binding protein n=1 Tax=unclassified Ochrobactrum TaxID=239106 RepID=UPI00309FCE5A